MFQLHRIGLITLFALLQGGCWSFPVPSGDTPDEFIETKRSVKTLVGETIDEVEATIGAPNWVVLNGSNIFYIYEWWSNEADIIMVGYLPMPWIFTEDDNEAHCILLEFNSDECLQDYKIDTESGGFHSWSPINCLEVFGFASKHTSGQSWVMSEPYTKASLNEIKIRVKRLHAESSKSTDGANTDYQRFLIEKPEMTNRDLWRYRY